MNDKVAKLREDVDHLMAAVVFDAGNDDIPVPHATDKVDYAHQRIDYLETGCKTDFERVRGDITKAENRVLLTVNESINGIHRRMNAAVSRLDDLESNPDTAPSIAPSMSEAQNGDLVIKLPAHLGSDHEVRAAVVALSELLARTTGLEMAQINWGSPVSPAADVEGPEPRKVELPHQMLTESESRTQVLDPPEDYLAAYYTA